MKASGLPHRLPVIPAHLRDLSGPDDAREGRSPPPPQAVASSGSGRVLAPYHPERVPPDLRRFWSALREVRDPEMPVSIVDLGLVYDVACSGALVTVDLTFTALGCPCMDFIKLDVRERLLAEPDVAAVEIREVWDPPWSRERMTEDARRVLRGLGVAA